MQRSGAHLLMPQGQCRCDEEDALEFTITSAVMLRHADEGVGMRLTPSSSPW